MKHWYHVTRQNENVMPLCVNEIHHIILTFESYLVNHQIYIYIYIYIFTPSQLFFRYFVWGRPYGKHLPSKLGDHFMLGLQNLGTNKPKKLEALECVHIICRGIVLGR
jgi:hypothetical protein